ncbi:MAG: hypothetical protein RJA22_1260 [Verrucomicrobiota bacterium]|jgi:hypothetical protein
MNALPQFLLLTLLLALTPGCRSLLPSEVKKDKTPWQSFAEAQAAFDRVIPHETSLQDLRQLGFDPAKTPNVRILTYLDLINRFLPNNSVRMEDLHPDVRACIEAKELSSAYELNIDVTDSQRYGSVLLDIFGFVKKSHIKGWRFQALILVKDDMVAYKLRSGQPNMDRNERRVKPLGPLQELDTMVNRIPGMF